MDSRARNSRPPAFGRSLCADRQIGFTLFELLIALLLAVLFLAIALPRMTNRTGHEARAAASTIAAAMRRTRSVAVRDHSAATFTLDVESNQFFVPRGAKNDVEKRKLSADLRLGLFTARTELESDSRGSIRFFPDGSSTGGRVTIEAEPVYYYVDVDWFSGQVRLESGKPEQEIQQQRGRIAL